MECEGMTTVYNNSIEWTSLRERIKLYFYRLENFSATIEHDDELVMNIKYTYDFLMDTMKDDIDRLFDLVDSQVGIVGTTNKGTNVKKAFILARDSTTIASARKDPGDKLSKLDITEARFV